MWLIDVVICFFRIIEEGQITTIQDNFNFNYDGSGNGEISHENYTFIIFPTDRQETVARIIFFIIPSDIKSNSLSRLITLINMRV